jgi:hypothetical protein
LSAATFAKHSPRRIRPDNPDITLESLKAEFGPSVQPISWLKGFYELDGDVRIANADSYRAGLVYGMDVSSGLHTRCDLLAMH